MVGNPGRSNGCQTCRKRRLKCDEARPRCQRCVKSGYKCAGYEKPLHFRIAVSSANEASMISRTAITSHFWNNDYSAVSMSLSLVSFRSDICNAFLLEDFVWRSYGYKWLHLAVSGKISPLAHQASSALSQSNFGSFHRQYDLLISGSIQYGKVVQKLILALSWPFKAAVEGLIVPIMILLIHESLLADQTGSISHGRGLTQLIMVCGPKRFQQEPLRSAFESCRATLITIGLISKKRCFPDEEKWQSIPWAIEPSCKSPQNYLADILVTVPGMLEDNAVCSRHYDSTARAALIDRLEHQLIKLFEWRWNWEKLNQFSAWEEPISLNPNRPAMTGQDRIFDTVLYFSAFEQATEIMLYNAVQMWLVGLLRELLPLKSPAIISSAAQISASRAGTLGDTNFNPLMLPGTSCSLREPAIEICRALEYQCLNVQHSRGAALFCLLPVGLAYGTLEHELQYRAWMQSILDLSPVMNGYVLGQNVIGFGLYYRYWRLPGITV